MSTGVHGDKTIHLEQFLFGRGIVTRVHYSETSGSQ